MKAQLNRLKRVQFILAPNYFLLFYSPSQQLCIYQVTTALCLLLLHLQFSTKKFSLLLSNPRPCIGNKLTCQWTIAYVWFAILFLPPFFSTVYHPSSFPRDSLLIYFPPLSFWLSFSFPNVLFASLLPPLFRLLSLFSLSSSLPGCRVMYGPCQRWNQWDAGCFNLA